MVRSFWRNRPRPFGLRPRQGARQAPASWRLLVLALGLGLVAQVFSYLMPIVAAVGLVGVWSLLARHATTQHLTEVADPWSSRAGRLQRAVGFSTGLLLLAGFLMLALAPLDLALRDVSSRETVLILASVGVVLILSFAMSAQGWRLGYCILTGLIALVALSAAVTLSGEPEAGNLDWVRTLGRLAVVFLAAEWLTPSAGGVDWKMRTAGFAGVRYLTLLMMLALVHQRSDGVGVASMETWFWWTLVGMVAMATLWFVWLARAPAMIDCRWWLRDRRVKPMPKGIVVALGFAPAVGLAAFAGWSFWLTVFGIGMTVGTLTRLNHRLDHPERTRIRALRASSRVRLAAGEAA